MDVQNIELIISDAKMTNKQIYIQFLTISAIFHIKFSMQMMDFLSEYWLSFWFMIIYHSTLAQIFREW